MTAPRSDQPDPAVRSLRSERFGDAFWLAFLVAFAMNAVEWVAGGELGGVAGRILRAGLLVSLAVSGLGWLLLRLHEERAGLHGSPVDRARPWVLPLLGIAAVGAAYWAVLELFG